jgi:hypothetical protein
LPVERTVACRVRAKADSMTIHDKQSMLHKRDFHWARSADWSSTGGLHKEVRTRGNVASHAGLHSVSAFEQFSHSHLTRLQRGCNARVQGVDQVVRPDSFYPLQRIGQWKQIPTVCLQTYLVNFPVHVVIAFLLCELCRCKGRIC